MEIFYLWAHFPSLRASNPPEKKGSSISVGQKGKMPWTFLGAFSKFINSVLAQDAQPRVKGNGSNLDRVLGEPNTPTLQLQKVTDTDGLDGLRTEPESWGKKQWKKA